MLMNLHGEFGEDMMSGRGFMGANPPFVLHVLGGNWPLTISE